MKNDKNSDLTLNTIIYFIGTSLSKLLNFLILPLISVMITTEELGVYDFIQTISSLIVPIITVQVIDGAFRFMYKKNEDEKKKVLTNVSIVIIIGICFLLLIGILFQFWFKNIDYINILIIYTITSVLLLMAQRVARSYELRMTYALSGIIQTITLLIGQYIFLKFTDLNYFGLVYSYAISCLISIIFLELKTKSIFSIKFKYFDKKLMKDILKFSIPLVPNSISWWGVSSLSKVLIIAFLGYSANGIYSMSSKFSGLITTVVSTFLLAFQEHAVTQKEKDNSNFTEIFNNFSLILSFMVCWLMFVQQVYFDIFIDEQYAESIQYIPLLMIAVLFSNFSSFYGTGYFVSKKTMGSLKTTFLGAIVNILLILLLIKPIGLWGVALASILSYFVIYLVRLITMKDYFIAKLNIKFLIFEIILIGVSVLIFYKNIYILSIISFAVYCLIFVLFYWKYIKNFIRNLSR